MIPGVICLNHTPNLPCKVITTSRSRFSIARMILRAQASTGMASLSSFEFFPVSVPSDLIARLLMPVLIQPGYMAGTLTPVADKSMRRLS